MLQAPQDAPEDAERAPCVCSIEVQTPQQQAQVVPVGGLHGTRRITGRLHALLYQLGEPVDCGGGRIRL